MLLTVGDSFTAKRWETDIPWPEILGFNMDLPVVNRSAEGMSNLYIFRNFIYELTINPDITHCVVALSNWDRLEVGVKGGLSNKYSDVWSPTKTVKMGYDVNKYNKEVYDAYSQYYNIKYYIDCTVGWISAIIDLCKLYDVKLIITQLVKPLGMSDQFKNGYISGFLESHKLFNSIDKSYIHGFKLEPDRIAMDHDKDSIWWPFCSKYIKEHGTSDYCMGLHENQGSRYTRAFDLHPSFKGHTMIAEEMHNAFNR